MMRRFSSSNLAGIVRTEVAVGTSSEASMFSAMRAAIPRSGVASSTSPDASSVGDSSSGAFFFSFGFWSDPFCWAPAEPSFAPPSLVALPSSFDFFSLEVPPLEESWGSALRGEARSGR
jgi:hypothetical protein